MDIFSTLEILSTSLGAERIRMSTTASNLANAQTTRTEAGGPYKRKDPVFSAVPVDKANIFSGELERALAVVEVNDIVEDQSPPRLEYDPGHPDANAKGYVAYPNVNVMEEMVNMMTASRAYESGVSAMRSVMDMANKALTIGK